MKRKIGVADAEFDAILAGLRTLQTYLSKGYEIPDDSQIGSILTNNGAHKGLDENQIDNLCEALNNGDRDV